MEQILTILGTIASLGGIPLSIYLYLKSKEAKFDKIKKEIVRTLSYQIGEEREITAFEIQTVINSKLRENRFKTNSVNIDEIVEDLVSETISSPMIDRNRKKIILDNLKNIYVKGEILEKLDSIKFTGEEKVTWENLEPKIKDLVASRKGLDDKIRSIEENREKSYERISTWFATISAGLTIIAGVAAIVGQESFQKLFEQLNQNKETTQIVFALMTGIITSILSGLLTTLLKRKQNADKSKNKSEK
ncbi:hypothetical protein G9409_10795 [Chlorobium sp. BLA1]|uniref:hypothetical protein n=1 Tax=Candidatus Chlorobium masyuteum TaxID=2716876 RepID=UPI001423A932|nr:hypothetical protein [Candidatus Chlorobium masyuteum]NHQ61059.1 hypothetical protein [Candidatus Chlorobium masyuteum]